MAPRTRSQAALEAIPDWQGQVAHPPPQPLAQPAQPAQPVAPAEPHTGRGRKSRKEEPPPKPSPSGGIDVKTKFPVARIKRIMQADEDVGKVAQVTPIAVCKFLLFFRPIAFAP